MKKYLLLFGLIACSQQEIPPANICKRALCIRNKYDSTMTVRLRDTSWNDIVCGRWVDSVQIWINKGVMVWGDWRNCPSPANFPWLKYETYWYEWAKK